MSVFEDIKTALNQAIEFEKGSLPARTFKRHISDVESFSPEEIKMIRNNTGMTQKLFAKYMGVSVRTVEAWEAGVNKPEGSSRRLLSITRNDPQFPQKSGIVTVVDGGVHFSGNSGNRTNMMIEKQENDLKHTEEMCTH